MSYEAVNLRTKQTTTNKDFTVINEKGAVPTLALDNHEILTENAVILQYLADSTHAYELLPKVGELERYRVLEWLNYITTELHKGFGPLFNPKIPQSLKDDIFIPLIKAKLDYVDNHLKNKDFIVLDHFTLADAYLFVMLTWAGSFNINISDWNNLSQYFTKLKSRASIEKSLNEETIS